MTSSDLDARVSAIRHFNRFYTHHIGLLQDGLLQSRFSLTEARVLYELAHRDKSTATDVRDALGLDQGYLSRILRDFGERGLVAKTASPSDRRQSLLSLTAKGRLAFGSLNQRSHKEVAASLSQLSETDQRQMVAAMHVIERLLNRTPSESMPVLRAHRPGDMGWVVAAHGALYAEEYGWDISFEALVAEIVAQFIKDFDPAREHCWIAELNGEQVGSVFLVDGGDNVAKLRLLIVDPKARGFGVGRKLVDECIRFARAKGYTQITLWTQSILTGARHIYQSTGFKLISQQTHPGWGKELTGETWRLDLLTP